MKNITELYDKYYNVYKIHYDSKDELSVAEKKKIDPNSWKLLVKKLATLPELLKSRNDFIEVTRFIKDISADTNNDKGSSGDKEVFNNLDS